MADDYQRGQMDIRDQEATFKGFMVVGVWATCLTAVGVLFLTLVFAMGWPVMPSVGVIFVAGIFGGLMVKLPSLWYVVLTLLSAGILVVNGIINVMGVIFGG